MIRQWAITTRKNGEYGTFLFNAKTKGLAHDHAMTLKHDIDFEYLYGKVFVSDNPDEKIREIAVRFFQWVKE